MTPLVAGIALTGKAPVYENVYMSGLKQKAAGEAARKKELSETEKQIRNSLKITGGTYHPTFHERVKDLTSTALAKSLEAMEKDPIRGINSALQIVNDATNVLGVYSENSKKLFEIEKPQYQKDFYAPSSFISAIGQKSFDEVMADRNLAKELEKYKIIVENRSGVPVLTVPAFARRNPAKELIDYQKSVVGQFPVEEGEITSLGGVRQQKLRQSMPDAQLEEMIIRMRKDDTDVAAWFYNHDVDITTDEGVKKAVQIAKYVEDKGLTVRPSGGGPGAPQETLEVLTDDKSSKIDVNWGGKKTITSKKTLIMPKTTMNTNFRGAFVVGEDANWSELSESEAKETGQFEVKDIRSMPTWAGKSITLSKGNYAGGVNLDSPVELKKGMPLPDNVKAALVDYVDNRLSDGQLVALFGIKDKAAIKAKIIDKDWMVGSGYDDEGKIKSETIFLEVNSENLLQLEKSMKGKAYEKIKRHLRNAASNPKILYNVKEIGQSKGAEKPQSFDLLNFEQPTA
jgi:hypothetical protein